MVRSLFAELKLESGAERTVSEHRRRQPKAQSDVEGMSSLHVGVEHGCILSVTAVISPVCG